MYGMDYEKDKQLMHPVIQRHKELLKRLSDERVIAILYDKTDGFYLLECCDEYFGHTLKRSECLELSELLKEIADEI